MKKKNRFSIYKRIKSFGYAIDGLKTLLLEEHNSRIHLCVAAAVIILGITLHISPYEWIAMVFTISLVFTMEIINTVIENIADFISPGKDIMIKKIKDLAAAGVLVSTIGAVATGAIVFVPKLKLIRVFLTQ